MFASNTSQVSSDAVFIEDVMSTYLYTGNGSTQTITNGIDLAGKGGLVWIKSRTDASDHSLEDTLRTVSIYAATLSSNTTAAQSAGDITGFTTSGFSLRDYTGATNSSGTNYASWTFREQAKFFDVVTYSGSASSQTINHSLGSTPGCIIIKKTNGATYWYVWHRGIHSTTSETNALYLNTTDANGAVGLTWISNITSTSFTLGVDGDFNNTGGTYVAYLFAHDAGGFGLTGTDNVISCGSFDGTANTNVTLGYEPQWIMFKNTTSASNWQIVDNMRGMFVGSADKQLMANLSNAESDNNLVSPTATGFTWIPSAAGNTYIYIAIRRGPMKVPTSGTSVFSPNTYTGNATARSISGLGFPPDLVFPKIRDNGGGFNGTFTDRLRGATNYLVPNDVSAESTNANYVTVLGQDGFSLGTGADVNRNTSTFISWNFKRAPSFFDEVCYTGTGVANTAFTHNLTVTPELMIVKPRSAATAPNWRVWSPINSTDFNLLQLSTNGAASSSLYSSSNVFPAIPTATTFTVGGSGSIQLNESGQTFVAYLFATCAGVSKVGSYTGTGTTKQVDCGFTGGARFVLIKRTDSTGDWYVWDTARGIVSGNDPYLLLNSTDAETTGTDYIDTYSAGFEISSTAPAAINASGGTFIFLAIA